MRHYEESASIPASVKQVFDYVDDHARLSSHMRQSSWMMVGGRMDMQADAGHGQVVGLRIRGAKADQKLSWTKPNIPCTSSPVPPRLGE